MTLACLLALSPHACAQTIVKLGANISTFLNIFLSETARQIKAQFHMKPSWTGENEACSIGALDPS